MNFLSMMMMLESELLCWLIISLLNSFSSLGFVLASLLDDELSSSESFVWICLKLKLRVIGLLFHFWMLLLDDELSSESLDWLFG